MKKAVWSGIIVAVGILGMSTPVFAQAVPDTKTVNVSVGVNARAKLTVNPAAIAFLDADPDVTATLVASAITVDVRARTTVAGGVLLTVQAVDDLKNAAGDVIAISGLTWTATGTNFAAGTSSKAAAITVGSWTGSGNRAGTQTYQLPNSWAYATGSYAAALTYTLTAP